MENLWLNIKNLSIDIGPQAEKSPNLEHESIFLILAFSWWYFIIQAEYIK